MIRILFFLLLTVVPGTWLLSPCYNLQASFENISSEPRGNYRSKAERILDKFSHTGIQKAALENGLVGYLKLKDQNLVQKDIMVVIDFTKSSTKERLYIVKPEEGKILHTSVVAHGRNSGNEYATSFSNRVGSNQSSLGFYLTDETYYGKHGLSLRLDGLEEGINDQARKRAVVIHSAEYADPAFARKHGRLGRSFGCPALPQKDYTKVINLIKDGAPLYIYHSQQEYFEQSPILSSTS